MEGKTPAQKTPVLALLSIPIRLEEATSPHSIPNKGVKTRMQENPVTHNDI